MPGISLQMRKSLKKNQQTTLKKLIENLNKFGAKDQLRLCVTGPAGAGKSTTVKVAQQFCFEFCRSIDIISKRERRGTTKAMPNPS